MCPSTPPKTLLRPVVTLAKKSPPPISGGTLLQTRDGKLLVAADSERDQLYFVDSVDKSVNFIQKLNAGDEPGRLVEDAAGRIHVALRGGAAIASMSREADSEIVRREVCDLPRGLAYDRAQDQLVVACAEGKLVRVPAEPSEPPVSSVDITRGARDVIARKDEVLVSYFRSAALVRVREDGSIDKAFAPPKFTTQSQSFPTASGPVPPPMNAPMPDVATPSTAWRMLDVPGRGVAMIHERANNGTVQIVQGGYGGGGFGSSCEVGIARSAITLGVDSDSPVSGDVVGATLAVDMAVDPSVSRLVLVAPGNFGIMPQIQVHSIGFQSALSPTATTSSAANSSGVDDGKQTSTPVAPCLNGQIMNEIVQGQAVAVTFVDDDMIAVQEREPAAITFIDLKTQRLVQRIDLKQISTFDTGHALFHQRASSGLACASCHAEAGDDGHVWTFANSGARRTQNLRGGILGTEPFHWSGDMTDFPTLVTEVFVKRMGGFQLDADQTSALAHWIDRQPEFVVHARDEDAAARGDELFHSDAVGCATCHAGEHFTNNQFADVGKGSMQVPSLRGVSFRVPLMHDGCALTLHDRFKPDCGGGDKHGHTKQLAPEQIDDLVAYLETL